MASRAPVNEGRSWSLAFAALLLTASLAGYAAVSSIRTLDEREDTIAHRYTENALRTERLLSATRGRMGAWPTGPATFSRTERRDSW